MAVSEREAVRLLSQSSSAVHNLIQENFIEPGGNLLKDQEILDIKQCYLNINYMRQFFLLQTDDQIFALNEHKTKDLKNGSCYKKVKVSCEAVSSVKYK